MPVYMNLQLTGGAARCVTTAPGGLLPRLFTLTATSAAVVFCHLNPTVTHGFPLRNVMLCVARTFLSQPCDVNERQATILLTFEATKLQRILYDRKSFATSLSTEPAMAGFIVISLGSFNGDRGNLSEPFIVKKENLIMLV